MKMKWEKMKMEVDLMLYKTSKTETGGYERARDRRNYKKLCYR